MYIAMARLTFNISYANSLKDKRQIRRSLIEKVQHRFNVSIAEVGSQDIPQILTIGIAVVSPENSHAQNSLDKIIHYMEGLTDAELVDIEMIQ